MSIESMITAVRLRAQGRFTVTDHAGFMPVSLGLPQLKQAHVVRLQRAGSSGGYRTLLIAESSFTSEDIHVVYRWAADIREQLEEPETADLYLLLRVEGIPDEEATRIETDDRFCRKVVLRSAESVSDFLDRTFLAPLFEDSDAGAIGDPLQAALGGLGAQYPWAAPHLVGWRESLLSGKTGVELARALESVVSGKTES